MRKLLFFIIILTQSSYSQENKNFDIYNTFFFSIKSLDFKAARKEFKIKTLSANLILKHYLFLVEDNGQSNFKEVNNLNLENTETTSKVDEVLKILIKAEYLLLYKNKRIKSYKFYNSALTEAKKLKYKPLLKLCYRSILKFYLKKNLQKNDFFFVLNDYKKICSDKEDYLYCYMYQFKLKGQTVIYNEKKSPLLKSNNIFYSYDSLIKKNNFTKLLVNYYFDKGNYVIRKNPLEAKKFYLKSLSLTDTTIFYKPYKFLVYANLSRVSSLLNKHKEGLKYLDTARVYININDSIKNLYALAIYKANHFSKLKKYDSAYFFSEKVRELGYKFNFQQENIEISKIREELNTEKKEKQILELDAKRKQNLLYLLTVSLLLILGSVIYILSYKNTKRKQKLAEQEKELAKQKNLTLLKEQEINTINAMVEGQEKERLRIAEDLHDNIGSVLATLKLHFENLKLNRAKKKFNQDKLYQKTEKLIDETYLKVRKIAHAKNSGVIANEGLLVAVQLMAEKISSAEKIKIDVVDFGLDKRLENQLEITVFRIIQELTTNIIKHAEANLATINLSLYEKNLNIIIEDDGKGFDTKKMKPKEGIGLSSIEKRVKHLNGSFTIDSTINKGTSIIIDVPLS